MNYTRGNGTPIAAHPSSNRKFHHGGHNEFNNATKTFQSKGHALLLGPRPHKKKHFKVFWKPGTTNLGDYHTKHHAPNHNRNVRKHNAYGTL